jgi:uncharacterized damage-inducible protein DinB
MSKILTNLFLEELKAEAGATRAILSLVPIEKGDYKPHEKSMKLMSLAVHVAEIPGWFGDATKKDVLDFATMEHKPFIPASNAELLAVYDKKINEAFTILETIDDEKLKENWTMRAGEIVYFTLPKSNVIRTWCLNHWYHHRAQLGVYLRMLDIPLPGTYGPSADMS